VEIRRDEFLAELSSVIRAQETPIPDGSMIAHYLLMRRIRELGVTVVLSGQGGDECLAGYVHTFAPAADADRLLKGKLPEGSPLRALFHALPERGKNGLRRAYYGRRFRRFFLDAEPLALVDDYYRHLAGRDRLASYLTASLNYWALPAFLHYDDRNSMAFSLETRGPFLDYRLAELCLALPGELLLKGGLGKRVLREAMADLLPPQVAGRRDKQGFHAPIEEWSASLPGDPRDDSRFVTDFPYLDLEAVSTDWMMKWRVHTLWTCHRELVRVPRSAEVGARDVVGAV
jgi:asparagine synthase (glutamine-hydrolysing)